MENLRESIITSRYGGKKGKPPGGKKCLLLLMALLALAMPLSAAELPPFEIVVAANAGFHDPTGHFSEAGGGLQIGTRVKVAGGLSAQALGTKVSIGNGSEIRKASTNLIESFEITKGSCLEVIFGAEHNAGGTDPQPSTDLAVGLGGRFSLVKWDDSPEWLRAPGLTGLVQLKWTDADNPINSYFEITAGVAFAPGERRPQGTIGAVPFPKYIKESEWLGAPLKKRTMVSIE